MSNNYDRKTPVTEKETTTIDDFDTVKVGKANSSSSYEVIENISHIVQATDLLTNFISSAFEPSLGNEILAKRKKIRRELLENGKDFIEKRIAILGGSTTHDIRDALDLFLLHNGIRATFYESEYAQYWQDAMFSNTKLKKFCPEIIYIHTTNRNILRFPDLNESAKDVESLMTETETHFITMWERLANEYGCPIIQNNFEYPFWRLQGNRDAADFHGRVNFITRLNLYFYEYAQTHDNFYINDINYLSANYGLQRWSDPFYWHMYKYALSLPAIPYLAHSIANIIKSLYGKNKKAFALDLDNTLWGGVVGDDGPENLLVGQETSLGQVYSEFQEYLKAHKQLGVILNIISKNEPDNAMAGLKHPDMTLKPDDFIIVKANWEPKTQNLVDIAHILSLTPDSFVFVDDNPAEREIVRQQIVNAAVPEIGEKPEYYINAIDRMGYFEVTTLSSDDAARTQMYRQNAARSRAETSFGNYEEYLCSLEMTAEIRSFEPMYMSRIAQLTNKSNQFNLTTRRFTQADITDMAKNERCITLYGKLSDKFGDNGIVSVIVGKIQDDHVDIILWLMSCRVLKRGMEYAMMDELVERCREKGISKILGYYYPTAKNSMVREFYGGQGFTKISEDSDGNTVWELNIGGGYDKKNKNIRVERKDI